MTLNFKFTWRRKNDPANSSLDIIHSKQQNIPKKILTMFNISDLKLTLQIGCVAQMHNGKK